MRNLLLVIAFTYTGCNMWGAWGIAIGFGVGAVLLLCNRDHRVDRNRRLVASQWHNQRAGSHPDHFEIGGVTGATFGAGVAASSLRDSSDDNLVSVDADGLSLFSGDSFKPEFANSGFPSGSSGVDDYDSQESTINPANGLPMVGCIDIEGNPYGCPSDSFSDDALSSSGFDDSLLSNFDDFSSSSFDDLSSSSFDDLSSSSFDDSFS